MESLFEDRRLHLSQHMKQCQGMFPEKPDCRRSHGGRWSLAVPAPSSSTTLPSRSPAPLWSELCPPVTWDVTSPFRSIPDSAVPAGAPRAKAAAASSRTGTPQQQTASTTQGVPAFVSSVSRSGVFNGLLPHAQP